MRIEIRNDSVLLDGYVNAVERDSRPINTAAGRVVERMKAGTFKKALERAENVDLLLDHDKVRKLGSTKDGNLQLYEDNIGLRAICTVTDPEVMEKARENKLKGWSFGQYVNEDEIETRGEDIPRRIVKDIDLVEVSIIDDRMNPCYVATSIERRAEKEVEIEQRSESFQAVTEMIGTSGNNIDYSEYENRLKKLHQA